MEAGQWSRFGGIAAERSANDDRRGEANYVLDKMLGRYEAFLEGYRPGPGEHMTCRGRDVFLVRKHDYQKLVPFKYRAVGANTIGITVEAPDSRLVGCLAPRRTVRIE